MTNPKDQVEKIRENMKVTFNIDKYHFLKQSTQTLLEAYRNELEFLEGLRIGFIARDTITPSKRDDISSKYVNERINELKEAIAILEGIQ